MKINLHCSLGTFPPSMSLQERLEWIAASGFNGFECGPPNLSEAAEFKKRNADLGLDFGVALYLPESADPEPLFESSLAAGAHYIEAQVDGYGRPQAWIDHRVQELLALAKQYGIPFFLETHRGRFTQDLMATLELIQRHPDLELCADFSHYVVCGEIRAPWPEQTKTRFRELLNRSGIFHLRLNSGQRVQDPLALIPEPQINEFIQIWREGLKLAKAKGREKFWITTEVLYSDYLYTDLQSNLIESTLQDTLRLKKIFSE